MGHRIQESGAELFERSDCFPRAALTLTHTHSVVNKFSQPNITSQFNGGTNI